ncbi:glycoside hydrolase family 20 zincin-like fold domain-containing protein [Verrucomicrobiota bacterium]
MRTESGKRIRGAAPLSNTSCGLPKLWRVFLTGLLMAMMVGGSMAATVRRPVAEVITPITGDNIDLAVFPQPKRESYSGQALQLTRATLDAKTLESTPAVFLIKKLLKTWNVPQTNVAPCRIVLRLIDPPAAWNPAPDQGYRLTIKPDKAGVTIGIEGGGKAGLFYGLQTLRQLVHIKEGRCYVREASIEDWPSVRFRGPASSENIRWKMNLVHFQFKWPPADPNAERRKNALAQLAATKRRIAKNKKQMDEAENSSDNLDASFDDILSDVSDERLLEHHKKTNVRLHKKLSDLQARIKSLGKGYERHKVTSAAALRERIAGYRAQHIEPVMHYLDWSACWGDAPPKKTSHEKHIQWLMDNAMSVYKMGFDRGVRNFSMEFHIAPFYDPTSTPTNPNLGEVQAQVVRQIIERLHALSPENRFFLEHQKKAVQNPPTINHVAGYRMKRNLDDLAAEFSAAGLPKDLQIMWSGCGRPAPKVTVDHARTMSKLFGGQPVSFLKMTSFRHIAPSLKGRFMTDTLNNGIGKWIGNSVMDAHDPELAKFLTFVDIPGWGNYEWGWNAEAYDVKRVMSILLRETLRGIGGGPAAYKELSALAQWQRDHGEYAMVGVGWFVHAMLSDDQNRLTPSQVDERMNAKREFYKARLAALRAALPPTGKNLVNLIEKEVRDRLEHLEFVAKAIRSKPTGVAIRATSPVTLDGALDEAAWAAAPDHGGFTGYRPGKGWGKASSAWVKVGVNTEFQVVYDDTHLYVAVTCEEADLDQIRTDPGLDFKEVAKGDHIRLLIDPSGMMQRATQLATTFHGQTIVGHEGWSTIRTTDPGPLLDWQWPRKFEVKTGRTADGWVAEFAIALKHIKAEQRPAPGRRWGFNVIRRQLGQGWTSSHHLYSNPRKGARSKPQPGIYENRFNWQQVSTGTEYRYDGPTYRGQILYCGELVFE